MNITQNRALQVDLKRVWQLSYPLNSAPSGARFQQVQVLNPPGSGKDIAESKGVHREVESEGSRMWGI